MDILNELYSLQDKNYAKFHSRLMPDSPSDYVIGVRTPELRKMASVLYGKNEYSDFLNELPHKYFEENQIHAFIISEIKDFNECITELEKFLPYIDNWATCDQTIPKAFKKNPEKILPYIDKWTASTHVYTIRFGIGMLMRFFLDDAFDDAYLEKVASLESDEYYVNMEIAWYMATALAKQWDFAIRIIEEKRLSKWVHNKTIQKAVESYRITAGQKEYLKTLKEL